jgi:hypothetical protein
LRVRQRVDYQLTDLHSLTWPVGVCLNEKNLFFLPDFIADQRASGGTAQGTHRTTEYSAADNAASNRADTGADLGIGQGGRAACQGDQAGSGCRE